MIIVLCVLYSYSSAATDNFSIYLVRHAEKQQNLVNGEKDKNPSLTSCGELRAKQLARILTSANIDNIYSTSYQRTMKTARPLANEQQIAIKNYNPRHLEQFALLLKQKKKNSLVVGHSNTTPFLTELLSDTKVEPIAEDDYQALYLVQFIGEQQVLTKLTQPLICNKTK